MAKAGAPLGNRNGAKGSEWRQAIKRALARKAGTTSFRDGLDLAADKVVDAAVDVGDQWAIKEIGERLDGKPAQAIVGDEGGPVQMEAVVRFVKSSGD